MNKKKCCANKVLLDEEILLESGDESRGKLIVINLRIRGQ
jgi:hypothetical protein